MESGQGEIVRYSETLARQTFYYAVKLSDGRILRLAKTTDSVFHTLMTSFTLLGLLMVLIILVEYVLAQQQTKSLIEPINNLNLEKPLDNVCYEELRPLLVRVDQQNKQIASQLEELKKTEAVRREFSANVSHELKTPLMSISGYAELMMNGMVRPENIADFSGRIYKEANRLGNLVADIIQLSRLDEQQDSTVSMENWKPTVLQWIYFQMAAQLQRPRQRKKKSFWIITESRQLFREYAMCFTKCFTILQIMQCAIPIQADTSIFMWEKEAESHFTG